MSKSCSQNGSLPLTTAARWPRCPFFADKLKDDGKVGNITVNGYSATCIRLIVLGLYGRSISVSYV